MPLLSPTDFLKQKISGGLPPPDVFLSKLAQRPTVNMAQYDQSSLSPRIQRAKQEADKASEKARKAEGLFTGTLKNVVSTEGPVVKGIQGITKAVGQSILRSGASVGLGAQTTGVNIQNQKEGKPLVTTSLAIDPTSPRWQQEIQKLLFGDEPVKDIYTRIAEAEIALPRGEALPGNIKASPKLGVPGILALTALDFTGAGGEKNVIKLLAKSDDIRFIANILRQIGVADDLVLPTAEVIVKTKNIDDVAKAINRIDELQKTTKVTPKILPKTPSVTPKTAPQQAVGVGDEIVEAVTKGGRERGFVTSAKEAVPEANKIAGQYIPRGTDDLAIRAKNLIKEHPVDAERLAMTGTDDRAVAVASELLKKYADDAANATDPSTANALYDKAADLANTIAPKLTEQGRAIQAASILGRLTPEGQVRFAAREIQRFNETAPLAKKIPELTGEQAKYITGEMKAINTMEEGVEKAMRFQKLQEMIQDLVPTPLIKKVITVWKAGLLTGLKTQGLNLFSNLAHGVTEIIKDVPAAIVDSVASLLSGKRTKVFTTRGSGSGIKEGFEKGLRYFKTGFDERNIAGKLDYKRVNFGKGPVAKAFKIYTETVFRFLGASDQSFYYGALTRSLMDQALAQGKNAGKKGKELLEYAYKIAENPTEEMIRYGTLDATTAVFQNQTKLGEAAKAVQKIPGVGEFFLPFGRTPSAVAMQIVNYSPVGIVKTIIENVGKGKFDQRLFSQGIGRGVTGTAIAGIGMAMAKEGLISLDYPMGDEREQELQKAEGVKNNAIKIGDKWRSPIVLGPAGNLILIGAHLQNALESSGSPSEAFSKAAFGSFGSFLEQTFVTGLRNALNAVTDPERYAKSYLPNLIASFVPTLVSDVARATDPLERRPETTKERIAARIPGARQTLEPQVDVLGRERERVGNPLEVMIDPTRPSPENETPVTQELRRLMDAGFRVSPTMLGDRQGYDALTQEENTRLWKYAGDMLNDKLTSLFASEKYQKISDDEKGRVVEKFVDQAKINARVGATLAITQGLSGEELKTKLAELKAGGLLNRDVYKKYLEVR